MGRRSNVMPEVNETYREEHIDFRSFVTESYDLQCVAGTNGMFYWLNPSWERVLGWTREELMAKPFLEFVHTDDLPATYAEIAKLENGDPTIRFENRYPHKDGGWRWLEWTARPTADGMVYAVARDITERRAMIRETQRQLGLLQMAEQVSGVGHWRVVLAEEHLNWSPQVYAIHGRDPAKFKPTLADGVSAYHPEDRAKVSEFVNEAVASKSSFDFQLRLVRHNDGEIRLVRSAGQPELDSHGNVVAIFGVFQDVTDQVAELRSRNDELERFAYAAAHDLQAPLKTVRGFGELLRDELGEELSSDAELYLDRMLASSQRMSRLTDGLLQFAHTVRSSQDRCEVDLGEVAREAVVAVDAQLRETGGEVEIGELPSVWGNEAQLGSVFQNLLSNAIRYRADDAPRIAVRAEADGRLWCVEVEDNGRGFDMTHAERVFALFQRLEPRQDGDVERPLGLGLSMCKRIVEGHGGTIGVRSAPGFGTTFRFTIPVSRQV